MRHRRGYDVCERSRRHKSLGQAASSDAGHVGPLELVLPEKRGWKRTRPEEIMAVQRALLSFCYVAHDSLARLVLVSDLRLCSRVPLPAVQWNIKRRTEGTHVR